MNSISLAVPNMNAPGVIFVHVAVGGPVAIVTWQVKKAFDVFDLLVEVRYLAEFHDPLAAQAFLGVAVDQVGADVVAEPARDRADRARNA